MDSSNNAAEADLPSDSELAKMLEQLDRQDTSRGKPLEIELVRELSQSDLVDLLPAAQAETAGAETRSVGSALISRIRHSHHQIARLLAEGRRDVEISALLGYSPSWISSLKNDPAFRELLAYYGCCRDEIMVDVMERQRDLGVAALEELSSRLDSDPESFANRELMELVDSNVNKPAARVTGFGGGTNAAAPIVNISFVTPEPKVLPPAGPIIDATPNYSKESVE